MEHALNLHITVTENSEKEIECLHPDVSEKVRPEIWTDNSSGGAKIANTVCVCGQFFRMSGSIFHLDRKKKKSEVDRIILKECILSFILSNILQNDNAILIGNCIHSREPNQQEKQK